MLLQPGTRILVDQIEEGVVLRAAGDIVVFQYTTIDDREVEGTVNVSRVTVRAD